MSEEIVSSISSVLDRWNPVGGDVATSVGPDGYKYEAMDILSTIRITKSTVEDAVKQVLTQAFKLSLNESELKKYSAEIERLINAK
tara:strand:+ start:399 stop:656 length:258 start_codon:yes stop_codon:yes gene_type:complete